MKEINKENGVFYIELEENEDTIKMHQFYSRKDIKEIHLPVGLKTICEEAFIFCSYLKKIYIPNTVTKFEANIFHGIYNTIEIFYDGTAEEWKELAKPYQKEVSVLVRGEWDKYPYYNSEGSYYKTETQWVNFLGLCPDCQVICNDGKRLFYGFSNRDKNND